MIPGSGFVGSARDFRILDIDCTNFGSSHAADIGELCSVSTLCSAFDEWESFTSSSKELLPISGSGCSAELVFIAA